MTAVDDRPLLVSRHISRTKLDRELSQWDAVRDSYRRRGYWILDRRDLTIDVAFVAPVPLIRPIPVLLAVARFDFTNYDVWAPSIQFVDAAGSGPAVPLYPPVELDAAGQLHQLLLDHPTLNRQFVCFAGVREYHEHPQHSGDLWLLHRQEGHGRLAVICERLWRAFTGVPIATQLSIGLVSDGAQLAIQWQRVSTAASQVTAPTEPATGVDQGSDAKPAGANPSSGEAATVTE